MFFLITLFDVLFGGLAAPLAASALVGAVATTVMAFENWMAKKNGEIGRNTVLSNQMEEEEKRAYEKAGIPWKGRIEYPTFFMVSAEDGLAKRQAHLIRAWFLTKSEQRTFFEMVRADQLSCPDGPLRERLNKIKAKLSAEDARELEKLVGAGSQNFETLKQLSDNRLMRDDIVIPYLKLLELGRREECRERNIPYIPDMVLRTAMAKAREEIMARRKKAA